ncbi:MAG: long-chain-fatty-acid--CoA ligase [Candidatus Sericytochromatia bacterium]|nr:MAG: long-chain-fatty-acid--CoA ligase [Candidatus Sericytochromatia bacterium]
MDKPWFKNYESNVKREIDITEFSSLADLFEKSITKFSSKPAFYNMGKNITYEELGILSKKFSSYLQNELELKKGDRVAIMMPNLLQYPVALFGILQAGMIVVNVNPLYTARELEHQLKDSGAKAIIILENSAHILEKVIKNTDVKHVIVTKIGDMLSPLKSLIVNFVVKHVKKMVPNWTIPNAIMFKDLINIADEKKFKKEDISRDDIAFLQYTGGTTGVSKGAILTHSNIIANFLQAREWIKNLINEGEEIIITALPLYHIFSLTANCMIFSSIGALNVLITNPRDIPNFVKELKKFKFTAITGVNTLFNALLNNEDFKNLDFSKLKVALGGGMAVQKAVAEKWKEVTKTPLIEAYGLTETSPAACINPMNLKEYNGYVGLPIPSTDIVIKDDNENNLEPGKEGELCVKGPQVMKGYWNKIEETEKVFTKDGYFKTGDIAYMTEDGFFKIVDRKKDMILVSGFNVYPNEVEDVIALHPKVLECAVVGIPDEKSGEIVKAFIVKKDESLTEEEIISFCKENLTAYKVPKKVEFRKELPKTNVGKILRRELK